MPYLTKNKKIVWVLGFALLFAVNILVEIALLPLMDLENTPKNDIYFKFWWICVGLWAVFGFPFKSRPSKSRNAEMAL